MESKILFHTEYNQSRQIFALSEIHRYQRLIEH